MPFEYTEELDAKHIRILGLQINHGALHGSLETHHIESLPQSNALPWKWPKSEDGDDLGTMDFVCNRFLMAISSYLYTALFSANPVLLTIYVLSLRSC